MTEQQTQKKLIHLHKIVEAGEKGFATAAANTSNPGVKILLKTYAQQRAQFKLEILAELHRTGKDVKPRSSIPGMIHRGRVAIFAAMTIEKDRREKVILKESALGEGVAVRTYENTLKGDLPAQARQLVSRQLDEVRKVSEQILLLRGYDGKQLVLQSFESEKSAAAVIQSLRMAGFPAEVITKISLDDLDMHRGRGATVLETVLSGAFGGALWGGLTGILVGFGVLQTISPAPVGAAAVLLTWALVALGFLLLGVFISSFLALFIGTSISDEDTHQVGEIDDRTRVIVEVLVNQARAGEAARIMEQAMLQTSQPILSTSK